MMSIQKYILAILTVSAGTTSGLECTDRTEQWTLDGVKGTCAEHLKVRSYFAICKHKGSDIYQNCCKTCEELTPYNTAVDKSRNYEVEMFFVLDNHAFKKYLDEESNNKAAAVVSARNDINYFITEINKLFKSLNPIKIQIRLKQLKIFTDGYSNIFDKSAIINKQRIVQRITTGVV